jgi:hypothetical protein
LYVVQLGLMDSRVSGRIVVGNTTIILLNHREKLKSCI